MADLTFVVMDRRTGEWCPDCQTATVVTAIVADGMRLINVTRCTSCLDGGRRDT